MSRRPTVFRWAIALAVVLLPWLEARPAEAQDTASGGLWSWPQPEVAEALSYLRLYPQDLALRDDYEPRDPWRLPLVDSVMTHPWRMPIFLQDYSNHVVWRPGPNRLGLCERAAALLPDQCPPPHIPDPLSAPSLLAIPPGLSDEWQSFIRLAYSGIRDTLQPERAIAASDTSVQELFFRQAFELVTADVLEVYKTADELDSVQQAQDRIAASMVSDADEVAWCAKLHDYAGLIDRLIAMLPHSIPHRVGGNQLLRIDTPYGPILLGTDSTDLFTGDPAIIIDPGGDDIYQLSPQRPGHPRLIVDCAGNDVYLAPGGFGLGCGYWSWGLLIDKSGDDTYKGGNFTMGTGWFGVGALIDLGGSDSYQSDTYTQGAGGFGIGILADSGQGNDRYSAALYAQGFGFAAGVGLLVDDGGNDTYLAGGKYGDDLRYRDRFISLSQGFAYGMRPHFSGGAGLLIDQGGNDIYTSDIFGQGGSYWFAFGGLYDADGNDRYIGYQYAQGAGTHLTAACLFDRAGDDIYSSKGVSQGCGHDWAAGILIDAAGNDRYDCTDLSQAAGSANGVGVLIDGAGDDMYEAVSNLNTQGYGNPRRDYGSIGLFLDLGGKDRYLGPGADSKVWLSRSLWGVGIDADSLWLNKVHSK
jgi:hypothetical protein